MAPSLSSSESQNSNREHELEIEDEQIFGDDDRNVLVQSDHLQMQSKKLFFPLFILGNLLLMSRLILYYLKFGTVCKVHL